MKVLGRALAVGALLALAGGAWGQVPVHYTLNSVVGNADDGSATHPGYGGIFLATMTSLGSPWGVQASVCNEIDRYISIGGTYDFAAYELNSISDADLQSWGSYGPPPNDGTGFHTGWDAKPNFGAIEYIIAEVMPTIAANGTIYGLSKTAGANAVQIAIWELWGFTAVPNFTAGSDAKRLYDIALDWQNSQHYRNDGVYWLRDDTQSQLTWDGTTQGNYTPKAAPTPEASSLLLLLPGLLPLGLLARKRSCA